MTDMFSYLWPRDLHTVWAALSPSTLLHTVPHSPKYDTSSLPSYFSNHLGPSTNLYFTGKTVVILKAIYVSKNSHCICILDMLSENLLCSNISHQIHGSCHTKTCLMAYANTASAQSDPGVCCPLTKLLDTRIYQLISNARMRPCACVR